VSGLGSQAPNCDTSDLGLFEHSRLLLDEARTISLLAKAAAYFSIATDYSARSIVTGSIRTAWITAGSAANKAAAKIVSDGSTSMGKSVGFTW